MRTLSARARLATCLLCSLTPVLGCGPDAGTERTTTSARVRARSSDARPLAGVRIWVDGREAGSTDDEGGLSITLAGHPGGKAVVTAACPATHRTLSARREVPLADETRPGSVARSAIELTVDCEPIERLAALVVRVRGPAPLGLPVRVRDRVVGQIDARGIAHVVLRVAPHTTLRVQLDTSTAPELTPRSPVQTFALGADDSVVLFDQTLARARPPRRKQRHEAARRPSTLLPYRVD